MHHYSTDGGTTWSNATVVLTRLGSRMETIAGSWFPTLLNGTGAMVLVTDSSAGMTPFVSARMDGGFEPVSPRILRAHPPDPRGDDPAPPKPGEWATGQVAFVPGSPDLPIARISFAEWQAIEVHSGEHNLTSRGYTHTVYEFSLSG